MKTAIRKTWPRITEVIVKGQMLYMIDARKQGTSGKREYRTTKTEAESRAREIAQDYLDDGAEGVKMDAALRVAALQGQAKLFPYGKTVGEAVDHFLRFLAAEETKAASMTVKFLAESWYESKANDKNKPLRKLTINGIKNCSKILVKEWGNLKITELEERHFEEYLNSLPFSQRRKFNIRSLMSQFYNWCIAKGYAEKNLLKKITITVPERDVEIFEVDRVQEIMSICEKQFPELMPYHAVCLFAGLRPQEAELLTWEKIHLEERQITVLSATSKMKETRNVPINDTLLCWLNSYRGDKREFILDQKTKVSQFKKFKIAAGYKRKDKNTKQFFNPKGESWTQDIMRHTFASYWLPKFQHRAELAEILGNSLDVIRKHYKQIVKNSDVQKFWQILPEEQRAKANARIRQRRKTLKPLNPDDSKHPLPPQLAIVK